MEGVTRKDIFRPCEWYDHRCWRSSHVVYKPPVHDISTINKSPVRGAVPWHLSPEQVVVDPHGRWNASILAKSRYSIPQSPLASTSTPVDEVKQVAPVSKPLDSIPDAKPLSIHNSPVHFHTTINPMRTNPQIHRRKVISRGEIQGRLPEHNKSSPQVPYVYPTSTT